MATDDLNAFLGGPSDAPEAPAPEPAPKPEPDAKLDAKPAPERDEDDDAALVPTSPDGRTVPLAALEAERQQRKDHKGRADRLEGEVAELRRQFEEARKAAAAPPPPQQPPQFQPPPLQPLTREDIERNPMALLERAQLVAEMQENKAWSDKLDLSEEALRDKLGDEAVDAIQADWKIMLAENPSLFTELRQQRSPYKFAAKKVEAWRAAKEVGDDPAAYRSKLEAELRAKWEAERAEPEPAQQRSGSMPRMAPSLATARSAAPRGSAGWNGPQSLDDILAGRKG